MRTYRGRGRMGWKKVKEHKEDERQMTEGEDKEERVKERRR